MLWGPSDEEEPAEAGSESGWVPPEARNWRHPSELHAAAFAAIFTVPRHRWRRRAAVVGAVGLVAVVAGTILLVQTGSAPPATNLDSMPVGTAAVTACCRLSPAVARGVEESIVSIEGAAGQHVATGCGVVVGVGLVATTSAALRGARRVRVLAATGASLDGTVVALDRASGVVVLRLSAQLPPGPVLDTPTLARGSDVVAVALRAAKPVGRPAPAWASGTVVSVGQPAPRNAAGGMATITMQGVSVPAMPGEALVDPRGRVQGMLVASDGPDRSFLPMAVVVGVSNELETMGKVRHGWLGVTDETVPGHPGAVVVWVDPHGAAAGKLRVGDSIVRVNGESVASSTALRSMLYVMAPGTSVRLDAERGSRKVKAVVRLAQAP